MQKKVASKIPRSRAGAPIAPIPIPGLAFPPVFPLLFLLVVIPIIPLPYYGHTTPSPRAALARYN